MEKAACWAPHLVCWGDKGPLELSPTLLAAHLGGIGGMGHKGRWAGLGIGKEERAEGLWAMWNILE